MLKDKPGQMVFTGSVKIQAICFSFRMGAAKVRLAIYDNSKGLRFLAKLLNDIADVDQTQIPDLNCPKGIGTHYHVYKRDGHMHAKSNDLVVDRLDGKETGSYDWFISSMDE